MGTRNEPSPEVSPEQKTTTDLIKRIRKLRWIGMDEEADQLQHRLGTFGIVPTNAIVASTCDTD
jgi:hypothetical protein